MGCIASGSFLISLSWYPIFSTQNHSNSFEGRKPVDFFQQHPIFQWVQETTWPNTHSVRGLSTYIVIWGQSIVIILTSHGGHFVSNLRLLDCLVNSLFSMILKNIVLNYCPFVTGIYRWPVKQKEPLSWRYHTLMLSSLHRHGSVLGNQDRYGEVRQTDILTKLKQLSIITKDIITIAGISGSNCPIQEEIFQLQIEFHEIQVLQDSCCQNFHIWQGLYYYVIQCAVDISRSFFFV